MGIDLMTGVRMTFEETLKCVIREDNVNIIGNSKDSKQLYFLYEPLTGLYKMGRGLDWWKRVSSLMKKWVYKSIKLSDVIYVVECESAWKAQAIEDAFGRTYESVTRLADIEETIYRPDGTIWKVDGKNSHNISGWVRNGSTEWCILEEGDKEEIISVMKNNSVRVL
mgnify:CR=1 FL=1